MKSMRRSVRSPRAIERCMSSGARRARRDGMMVLICYDGSADAQAAIDRAGRLMPGSDATVLVIWETLLEMMTRNGSLGMGFGMVGADTDDGTDVALEKAALETATDGVQRPRPPDSSRSLESSIGTTTSPPTSLPWRTMWTPT